MLDAAHQQRLDRIYRYQRHFYDLTRKYYLVGRDTLIAGLLPPDGGSVLEIGCGTGRNLVLAARRYPDARFYGVDLSPQMLEKAAKAVRHAGLEGRISLAHGDATTFEPGRIFDAEKFDRVVLSYALSMIPDWRLAVRHGAMLLAPGGALHIVDFGDGARLPSPANAALRSWLRKFHVTPRDELKTELRRIAAERSATLFCTPIFRTYAVYAVLRDG